MNGATVAAEEQSDSKRSDGRVQKKNQRSGKISKFNLLIILDPDFFCLKEKNINEDLKQLTRR